MLECRKRLAEFFEEHGVPEDSDEVVLGNLHWIEDWTNGGKGCHCLRDVEDGYGKIVSDLWGAHAVVVMQKGYDAWLKSYLEVKNEINADFFNWLVPSCYAASRSFFLQKKDVLQYEDFLCDKQHLSCFPEK